MVNIIFVEGRNVEYFSKNQAISTEKICNRDNETATSDFKLLFRKGEWKTLCKVDNLSEYAILALSQFCGHFF